MGAPPNTGCKSSKKKLVQN